MKEAIKNNRHLSKKKQRLSKYKFDINNDKNSIKRVLRNMPICHHRKHQSSGLRP